MYYRNEINKNTNMKKIILLFFMFLQIQILSAQTYAYRLEYYVLSDGMKSSNAGACAVGRIFYFTFNGNKSMCYMTDKNGNYNLGNGIGKYQYLGCRNNMYIFEECSTNMFKPKQDKLYFSKDFNRMNWHSYYDNFMDDGNDKTRVLTYTSNPNRQSEQSHLY